MSQSSFGKQKSVKMLVKKYRPTRLDDIVGHTKLMMVLKEYVREGDIPHMTFTGPPGNGKTSAAECLRYEFGLKAQDYLELNIGDERGIATVRKKILNFAKAMAISDCGFKLCVLDQADAMTKSAQNALCRMMETYPHIRFILTCNNLSKIHRAVQSRAIPHHFKGLHYKRMEQLVDKVAKMEAYHASAAVVTAIRQVSRGDARIALNTLQSVIAMGQVTPEDIFALHGVAPDESIFHLINSALKGTDPKSTLKVMRELNKVASPTKTIRAIFGIATRGNMPGMSVEKQLRLLNAIGSVPGATDEHRLATIVVKILISKT